MKKTIVALVALCSIGCGMLSAQTIKKTTKGKTSKTNKEAKTKVDVNFFEGTIYYSKIEKPAPMPIPKAAPDKIKTSKYNIESKLSAAVPPKKELKANIEHRYYFTKDACYFNMMGLYGEYLSNDHKYIMGFTNPDNQYVKNLNYVSVLMADFWSTMKSVQEAQSKNEFDKADKLLEKFYVRTSDEVTLAGYKAVRYEVRLPQYHGDIWVAEELWLSTWMAPFWGMVHPVLEFDFSFPVKGFQEKKFRMVADAVKEEYTEEEIHYIGKQYTDCLEVPTEEFEDFLRIYLNENLK